MVHTVACPAPGGIEEIGTVTEQSRPLLDVADGWFVSSAFEFDVASEAPLAHPAVPELGVSLIASSEGPLTVDTPAGRRLSAAVLAFGPSTRPRLVRSGPSMRGVHLTLTPDGCRTLLGVPMSALTDEVVDLADLPTGWTFPDGHPSRPRRAQPSHRLDTSCAVAQRWWTGVVRAQPTARLDDLAALAGMSPRAMRDLVAAEFGLAPKSWQRLARHHHARRLAGEGHPLAGVAAEAGYADQAHMQREWRAFSLQTPTQSLRCAYLPPAAATNALRFQRTN